MRRLIIIICFSIASLVLSAQVLPKDGSELSYRIVGLSFPSVKGFHDYGIEVADGNYVTEDSFVKNIVITRHCKINRAIVDVPAFGKTYTWRVIYTGKNKRAEKSALYHFSTVVSDAADTTSTRLRVLQGATAYTDHYITLEGSGAIYDMLGRLAWCMPGQNKFAGNRIDMKFTPQGTITFLAGQTGYEISYDGKVLWRTPPHDTVCGSDGPDFYHHEFTRLSNGHYMVLGTEYMWCKTHYVNDSCYITATVDNANHAGTKGGAGVKNRARFGVIIEFDEQGKVVWSWKSSQYLLSSDYVYYHPADTNLKYEPHDNAFFFDEKNKAIYLGFRHLGRIVKIEYPSGKVLDVYGEKFKKGESQKGNDLFCCQHSLNISSDGSLYIFNNNSCHDSSALPTILMVRESGRGVLKKEWEYPCTAEVSTPGGFPSGGNATELPDGSMYICMGSDYGKCLIVSRDKQILWSALPEKYDAEEKIWKVPKKTYRSAIISRKDLERMIWNIENN